MPKRITLHVVLRRDVWVVRKEDSIRAISTHNTKREAVNVAREEARRKHGALIIHGKDGRVAERRRYNSDPLPPKSAGEVLFPLSLDDDARRSIQATVDMVMRKRRASQRVVARGRGRAVRSEGKSRSSSVHDTQSDAVAAAKESSRKQDGKLLVHGRHGQNPKNLN